MRGRPGPLQAGGRAPADQTEGMNTNESPGDIRGRKRSVAERMREYDGDDRVKLEFKPRETSSLDLLLHGHDMFEPPRGTIELRSESGTVARVLFPPRRSEPRNE